MGHRSGEAHDAWPDGFCRERTCRTPPIGVYRCASVVEILCFLRARRSLGDAPVGTTPRHSAMCLTGARGPVRAFSKDFAVARSVLSTARKQGWDILQTLIGDPVRLVAELRQG
jgi:hypothetical protein